MASANFRVGWRLRDRAAVIMLAPAHHRPAVILAGLRDVELVPAARTEFILSKLAGLRVDGGPLRIAVPVGPDLETGFLAADERIVLRGRSIGIDAHDLAEVIR